MIFDLSKDSGKDMAISLINRLKTLVEIKEYRPKRTNLQNRYYWAICSCFGHHVGMTKEDIHDKVKAHFLRKEEFKPATKFDRFNEWMWSTPSESSTTDLNTKEFAELIDNIKLLIIDLFDGELRIPEPTDKDFDQFLRHYENYI